MKLRTLSVTLALGLASASIAPQAHAQGIPGVILCTAGGVPGFGTTGGPACIPYRETFFNIVVLDPWGNPDPFLTAASRTLYLNTDPTAALNEGAIAAEVSFYFFDFYVDPVI